MSGHTPTPPIDQGCTLVFIGPVEQADSARAALQALGFAEAPDTIPWRACFPDWSTAQLPGVALAGARQKEGLTQTQLAQQTGMPQRHISEIEHGKRPIGKERAKKLAAVLQVDYHIFL